MNIEERDRQGCVLSPNLFSFYTQLVMNELAKLEPTDNMFLLTDNEEKLQRLMDDLNEQYKLKGLTTNRNKMEVVGVTRRRKNRL